MKYPIHKALPIRSFFTVQDLEDQMSREPAISKGFWIKLSKAGAPKETVTKEQTIEAALCCGWIDGQLDKFDEHYFLIRMTPRRSGSRWSAKKLRDSRPACKVEPPQTGGTCRDHGSKKRWPMGGRISFAE